MEAQFQSKASPCRFVMNSDIDKFYSVHQEGPTASPFNTAKYTLSSNIMSRLYFLFPTFPLTPNLLRHRFHTVQYN